MTPRRCFLNALAGRAVDRTPVANPTSLVTLELQQRLGVYFPQANFEPELMARLALAGHTVCGYDVVFPVFAGGTHEAEALGATVRPGDPEHLPEAGADALIFGDHITADLIRPDACPRFARCH